MADVEVSPGSGTLDSTVNQLFEPWPEKVSNTSISVRVFRLGMPGTPTSYKITYQPMINKKTSAGGSQTITTVSNPHTITGLTVNVLYKITTQAISATGEGNKMTVFYKIDPAGEVVQSKSSTPKTIGEKVDTKSFLKLTGSNEWDNKYTFAYRDFESIQLKSPTNTQIGEGAFARLVPNYPVGYYSFGTMFMLPSLISGYKAQGAGIGFFLNEAKDSGYFITVDTTGTAATQQAKPVKIFKLQNQQIRPLTSSQKGNVKTLDMVLGGRAYNIDIKVKILVNKIDIIAFVNGFEITASDTTASLSSNTILPPTKTVALVATAGTAHFDYVYADTIEEKDYLDKTSLNFYKGQFNKDIINILYGNMSYEANEEDTGNDSIEERKQAFDEFGTVVREITRRKASFNSAPSIPVRFTTGANNLAQIVSQSYNHFGGEVFVLNNSSITVPLTDGASNKLSVFGYDIAFSGDIVYDTEPSSENIVKEPVIFESQWLHFENDVKKLADWIRGRIVNKSIIVEMEVFGNPLISVGDIITVDYAYQGFTSSKKIIVIKVSQSFEKGLKTSIVGRTL